MDQSGYDVHDDDGVDDDDDDNDDDMMMMVMMMLMKNRVFKCMQIPVIAWHSKRGWGRNNCVSFSNYGYCASDAKCNAMHVIQYLCKNVSHVVELDFVGQV